MKIERLLIVFAALPLFVHAQQVTVVPSMLENKAQLAIRISGLPPSTQARQLVADLEVVGADGRTMVAAPGCCRATIAKGAPGVAQLDPTLTIELESTRRASIYTVKVSVTDGEKTWSTHQVLTFTDSSQPGTANEAPRLRQNVPEGANPEDKRDCLGLSSPSEVIKCSEKKKR